MIYVNFKPADTVQGFLKQLFYIRDDYRYSTGFVETFNDANCRTQQCGRQRMRSFDDVLEIIQTYFPSYSPENLMHDLLVFEIYCSTTKEQERKFNGKRLLMQFSNCSTMKRIRVLFQCNEDRDIGINKGSDIFCTSYESKWNWKDLLHSIGIKPCNTNNEYNEEISKYMAKFKQK